MSNDSQHILDFIRHLLSATANASLYGIDHPQVDRLSSQSFVSIGEILKSRPEVTLIIVENELIIDGQPQELGLFLDRFIHILKSRKIGTIKLLSGISKYEVNALINRLSKQLDDGSKEMESSDHIRFGKVDLQISGLSGDADLAGSEIPNITLPDMPRIELAKFMEIYETVKNKHKLQINGVYDVVSGFINVFRQEGKPLLAMAALKETDEYTFTHSTNVCVLNLAQAMALGIEGQLLNDIGVAAMLHDIGKMFIPEEILTKTGKLSDEEFSIIKQHPVKGARYLLETPGVPRLAVVSAYEHHLKFDLSGYPKVPTGWEQNLCSHMTAISDFFDALRTKRPYRKSVEVEQITNMMQNMIGVDLHPTLTRNFIKIMSGLTETTDRI